MKIDSKITSFVKRHHVLTLATSIDNAPYCANLFYSWMEPYGYIVFTSDHSTRHGAEALANSRVAASIVLETRVVGKVEGLQIEGEMVAVDKESELFDQVKSCYIKRFPYAALAELSLWYLKPSRMKLTDNKLGFGKKIIWQDDEQ